MKKFIALAILAASCQTTPKIMKEPDRSSVYKECLVAGLTVTTCSCMEEYAVDKTGYTRPLYDFGYPSSQMDAFVAALQESFPTCEAKTQKQIEADNDQAKKR